MVLNILLFQIVMIVKYGVILYDWGNYCNRDIQVNILIKEWYVLIIVVIVKDKIIVRDNIGVGDELLKMVKQKRVCNINNNQSINIC